MDDCAELELDESSLDGENWARSSSYEYDDDDDCDALALELPELDGLDDAVPPVLPLTAATPNTIAASPTPVAVARERQLRRQR